jgi:hypothetical protein
MTKKSLRAILRVSELFEVSQSCFKGFRSATRVSGPFKGLRSAHEDCEHYILSLSGV